jgi:hypothetical protein
MASSVKNDEIVLKMVVKDLFQYINSKEENEEKKEKEKEEKKDEKKEEIIEEKKQVSEIFMTGLVTGVIMVSVIVLCYK